MLKNWWLLVLNITTMKMIQEELIARREESEDFVVTLITHRLPINTLQVDINTDSFWKDWYDYFPLVMKMTMQTRVINYGI